MNLKRFWKSSSALAAIFLISAAPVLSQQTPGSPNVVVYESPT